MVVIGRLLELLRSFVLDEVELDLRIKINDNAGTIPSEIIKGNTTNVYDPFYKAMSSLPGNGQEYDDVRVAWVGRE